MQRHTNKPGITGWAQVNGYRGQTDELWKMEKRVEYDVWYAENWNFMLDIKIIFLTIYKAIFGDKNAFYSGRGFSSHKAGGTQSRWRGLFSMTTWGRLGVVLRARNLANMEQMRWVVLP